MSYNDVVLGDLDGNGAINILDVVLLVNIVLGVLDPTYQQQISADLLSIPRNLLHKYTSIHEI